jgi:hypothetical protein
MSKIKLGSLIQDMRGKTGNSVVVKTRSGLIARAYTIPGDPRTESQLAARNRFAIATIAFKNLTPEQADEWREYTQKQPYHDPITGKKTTLSAIAAFTRLTAKFLQINPNEQIPIAPPSQDFEEDQITLTATPLENAIRFTASAPNSANAKTEILLEKLPSRNRAPKAGHYRTKAFVHFTQNSPTFDLPTDPGIHAPAYRFVNPQTGQRTELIPLNTIKVEA